MTTLEKYESDQLNEFALAMSKAQGKMKRAAKDCNNPFYKSKYADLSSVSDAIKEVFEENKIAVFQRTEDTVDRVTVCTKLVHESGQWIQSKNSMPAFITERADKYDKSSIVMIQRPMTCQEVGSVITYLRRFQLSALAGVCPEDDDGNNVSGKQVIAAAQPAKISRDQFTIVSKKLDLVPQYKVQIKEWLAKQGINDLLDMHATMFDGITRGADKANEQQLTEKTA